MAKCTATRPDGSPCRAQAMKGKGLCFFHDPESRDSLIEAARRGGARRTVELPENPLLTPARARGILAGVIEAAVSGAIDNATARTVGYLLQIEARICEGHDLERRIDALEVIQREAG